jgi:hypothetical protein
MEIAAPFGNNDESKAGRKIIWARKEPKKKKTATRIPNKKKKPQ